MKRIILTVLAMIVPAMPALARPNPQPKPSGVVVHLFGPNSLTSNILPSFVAARPAAATPGGAPPAGVTGTGGGPAQPTADAGNGPTVGDVLHQMFVVGDPNRAPGAATAPGRAAEHPRAVNP